MTKRLNDKVAIITGGANGIGLKTAELFAMNGSKTIIIDVLPLSNGISNKYSSFIDYLQLDVSQEKSWIKIMEYVKSKYKKLDILVGNAAVTGYEQIQDPENMSLFTWNKVHLMNLVSIFLGCKYAISLMKKTKVKSKSCSIINISSRSGIVGVPNLAAYASSKAAIRNYTKSVAAYCAQKDYNIRCNTISPASIDTKMWDHLRKDKKLFEEFCYNLPLKRMGKPEDVAYACLYLASDEAAYTTGSEIIVDGGILSTFGALPK